MTRALSLARKITRDDQGYCRGAGWELWIEVEPRDLWVGVYWHLSPGGGMLDVYVCLVPCLPLHLCCWTGGGRFW